MWGSAKFWPKNNLFSYYNQMMTFLYRSMDSAAQHGIKAQIFKQSEDQINGKLVFDLGPFFLFCSRDDY